MGAARGAERRMKPKTRAWERGFKPFDFAWLDRPLQSDRAWSALPATIKSCECYAGFGGGCPAVSRPLFPSTAPAPDSSNDVPGGCPIGAVSLPHAHSTPR